MTPTVVRPRGRGCCEAGASVIGRSPRGRQPMARRGAAAGDDVARRLPIGRAGCRRSPRADWRRAQSIPGGSRDYRSREGAPGPAPRGAPAHGEGRAWDPERARPPPASCLPYPLSPLPLRSANPLLTAPKAPPSPSRDPSSPRGPLSTPVTPRISPPPSRLRRQLRAPAPSRCRAQTERPPLNGAVVLPTRGHKARPVAAAPRGLILAPPVPAPIPAGSPEPAVAAAARPSPVFASPPLRLSPRSLAPPLPGLRRCRSTPGPPGAPSPPAPVPVPVPLAAAERRDPPAEPGRCCGGQSHECGLSPPRRDLRPPRGRMRGAQRALCLLLVASASLAALYLHLWAPKGPPSVDLRRPPPRAAAAPPAAPRPRLPPRALPPQGGSDGAAAQERLLVRGGGGGGAGAAPTAAALRARPGRVRLRQRLQPRGAAAAAAAAGARVPQLPEPGADPR
ncbi:beta-1,4 N-acetylgalactosaminyltransferase 1 isoform X2 [Catharus ustulatus]|uniref:beta-1,4 N-acetylgalactosaminyltransferase 1 isoform X2 n=1 Tax=Catharus ustulatus TaxID=91951 RepID=UPI00140B0132|nr:beta-1,4 N-acetylgalactosaminyltransferase 1 isoform X2 [Catharus ustulatus]